MSNATIGYRTFATRADAERQRDALDVAAGYPRQTPLDEVTFVGPAARRIDPAKLRDEHVVDVQEDASGTEFAIAVTEQADALHGLAVDVRGEDVTVDTRSGRVAQRPFSRAGGARSGGTP